jgi:hypothetical protein
MLGEHCLASTTELRMMDNLQQHEQEKEEATTTIEAEAAVASTKPTSLKGNILKRLKEDIGRGATEFNFGQYTK